MGQHVASANVQGILNGVLTNATFIGPGDVYYAPSESAKYTLVVQPNFVARWPPSALPGAGTYWSEPISANNREWWIIGGWDPNNELGGPDWPANTNTYTDNYLYNFVPYVTGPTSAHIVWRMQTPSADDGIVGGYFYGTPSLYQASWEDFAGVEESFGNTGPGVNGNPSIAYDGRGYITLKTTFDGVVQSVWECFNLQTGQIYWQHTGITNPPTLVSISQAAPPVPGATSRASLTSPDPVYLSTSRIIEYDPISGAVVNNVTLPVSPGLSSSILYADPYVLSIQNIGTTSNPNYRLINWTLDGIGTATTAALFQAQIVSNITWPFPTIGYPDYEAGISGYVYSGTVSQTAVAANVSVAAASLTTGQLLWNESSGCSIFRLHQQRNQ